MEVLQYYVSWLTILVYTNLCKLLKLRYLKLNFLVNGLGYWLFHCHIEFHVEVGMATVFKIGEDWDMPPTPPSFPKCGNYNGKDLLSFSYQENNELQYPNINKYDHSDLDTGNDSRTNMISTLGKWWPFVGGAHPYVASASASVHTPYISILMCIVISLLFIK